MCRRWLFRLIVILMGNAAILQSLEVTLTSDVRDIFSGHVLRLNVHFAPDDKALYRESLRFSVDNPQIKLVSWRPSVEHVLEYVPSFKQTKKLFTQSFDIFLHFRFLRTERAQQLQDLAATKVFIGYVVMSSAPEGKNKARVATVALPQTTLQFDQMRTSTAHGDHERDKNFERGLHAQYKKKRSGELDVLEQINQSWHMIKAVWFMVVGANAVRFAGFIWLLLFIIFAVLWYISRFPRRLTVLLSPPLPIFFSFIACMGLLNLLRSAPDSLFYLVMLGSCTAYGFALLSATRNLPDRFVVKLCRLIGFVLLMVIFPLIIKLLVG